MQDESDGPSGKATPTRRELLGAAGITGAGFLSASVLAACGGKSSPAAATVNRSFVGGAPPKAASGTLRAALPGAVSTMDPGLLNLGEDFNLAVNVFDGLVRYNDDYTAVAPALAASWEHSDDAREWTFHLRSGVKFHDGTPLDSTAVKTAFKYIAGATGGIVVPPLIPKTAKLDDSDPSVFKISSPTPLPDFAQSATLIFIPSPAAVKRGPHSLNTKPVGTGPFQFVGQSPSQLRLAASSDYWEGGPFVNQLDLPIIADSATAVSALLSGDLDIAPWNLTPLQEGQLAHNPTVKVDNRPVWGINVLGFNCTLPAVKDPRVRQAIAYGIDRVEINKTLLAGHLSLADSVIPSGDKLHTPATTQYEHDPTKAKTLLRAAGHKSGLHLNLLFDSETYQAEAITQAIVGQLSDVGVNVRTTGLAGAAFVKAALAPSSAYQLLYSQYFDLTGTPLYLMGGILSAVTRFAPPELKALYGKVASLPDGPERQAAASRVLNMFNDQMALYGLYNLPSVVAERPKVYGFVPARNGASQYYGRAYVSH